MSPPLEGDSAPTCWQALKSRMSDNTENELFYPVKKDLGLDLNEWDFTRFWLNKYKQQNSCLPCI